MDEREALLNELAELRGLGAAFYDHRGALKYFSRESRHAILRAMGVPLDDVMALRAARAQLRERAERRSTREFARCYEPPELARERVWGLSIQLYTLRSDRNWGIGDFADLLELIDVAAPLGCDVIGLNPLHALFLAEPTQCSPYSPSSRLFLNPLYIAVDAVPEYRASQEAQTMFGQATFQSALAALRALPTVQYEQVTSLKLGALRLAHREFVDGELARDSPRAQAFRAFVARGGEALRLHALFEALDAHFRVQSVSGVRHWPDAYRDPKSMAVRRFASERNSDVRFYLYLQWLADEQFAHAQQHARARGLRIGLYGDLAVGANPDGSEVWSNRELFVTGVSVGAPPDPLALGGQDWGIPPIDPHALREHEFEPFLQLLRANMRVGALRIDHVMSLFRLWWVPENRSATEGVYVHYPIEELAHVLASESARAACLVVGEDLGTVPDEVRHAMERYGLYHYKVLLFEKHDDGRFKLPHEYVPAALATATTHDLPPLKAWWEGTDLELREALKLYPSADTAQRVREERAADRRALLRALNQARLWFWSDHEPLPEFSPALARALHLYLGLSRAALVLVQLEDLIGMTDPINVPGTHTEHPNWQRKIAATTSEMFAREDVIETLRALGKARRGLDPNRE